MKQNSFTWTAAIGWLGLTIILLTLPGSAFPKEDWLSRIWFDKWVHIGLFAILVILWCRAAQLRSRTPQLARRNFLMVTLGAILYGAVMEFVQRYWIPNRSFDIYDIIADAVGSWGGYGLALRGYIKK